MKTITINNKKYEYCYGSDNKLILKLVIDPTTVSLPSNLPLEFNIRACLHDYEQDKFFCTDDDGYAIEYEITVEDFEGYFYDEPVREESKNIREIIWLHEKSKSTILSTMNTVEDLYKNKKPVGEDEYTSGWRHVHLFLTENGYEYTKKNINSKSLYYKQINCPLWMNFRIVDNKLQSYSRRLGSRASSPDSTQLGVDSKSEATTLKRSYYSHENTNSYVDSINKHSIEFRLNNVIDRRIIAYYQAVLLATEQGVKLKKTSDDFRQYMKLGDTNNYTQEELSYNNLPRYHISEQDQKVIKHNIRVLIKVLLNNWMVRSAKQLKEYTSSLFPNQFTS